ncbi:MAG: type II secretion system protein GspL [Pseudomonadota bacterium]
MSRCVCRWHDAAAGELEWVIASDEGQILAPLRRGGIEELVGASAGHAVDLLIDAATVSTFEIRVPAKNAKVFASALPFAVEEHVAQEPGELIIAVGPEQARHHYPVAVISATEFERQLESLQEAGLELDSALVEFELVPTLSRELVLLLEGTNILAKVDPYQGFKSLSHHVEAFIVSALADQQTEFPKVRVFATPGDDHQKAKELADRLAGLATFEVETLPHDPLTAAVIADRFERHFDFLKVREQHTNEEAGRNRWWALAASLIAVALLTHAFNQYQQATTIEARATQVNERTEALFRSTFPEVKRIVDVRAQSLQQLEEIEAGYAARPTDFLAVLHDLGTTAKRGNLASKITLTELSFSQDALTVSLTAGAVEDVENYRRALEAKALAVNLLSAEPGEEDVVARLRVAK